MHVSIAFFDVVNYRCFAGRLMDSQESNLVGFARLEKDGTISVELRVTPSGQRVRNSFSLHLGDPDYELYLKHLGPDPQVGPRYGVSIFPTDYPAEGS
jgi:hypothetical protein